jgi:hypothetical protein
MQTQKVQSFDGLISIYIDSKTQTCQIKTSLDAESTVNILDEVSDYFIERIIPKKPELWN